MTPSAHARDAYNAAYPNNVRVAHVIPLRAPATAGRSARCSPLRAPAEVAAATSTSTTATKAKANTAKKRLRATVTASSDDEQRASTPPNFQLDPSDTFRCSHRRRAAQRRTLFRRRHLDHKHRREFTATAAMFAGHRPTLIMNRTPTVMGSHALTTSVPGNRPTYLCARQSIEVANWVAARACSVIRCVLLCVCMYFSWSGNNILGLTFLLWECQCKWTRQNLAPVSGKREEVVRVWFLMSNSVEKSDDAAPICEMYWLTLKAEGRRRGKVSKERF